jgi:DNA modification methylase
MLPAVCKDATVYVCTSHHLANVIWTWMAEWAAHHSWCVWNKPNPMPSLMKRHWTWNAELVAYATRGRHTFNFPDGEHALSVWTFTKHKDTDHPTEKPVEVPAHAIAHSSLQGDRILDPFLGSGTTMVAAEQLGRICYGIEIEPKYVAVILQRMTDMGLEPRRADG